MQPPVDAVRVVVTAHARERYALRFRRAPDAEILTRFAAAVPVDDREVRRLQARSLPQLAGRVRPGVIHARDGDCVFVTRLHERDAGVLVVLTVYRDDYYRQD